MTEELPAPKSRKEEYLATAAGMTGIELPEPASREEIYLDAIAQGGGGGGGGTSDFDQLSNRPKYNGTAMTSTTDIPEVPPKMVVLSYGTSTWQNFLDAYNDNAVVYCKASSGNDPSSGAQSRMAFMAYVSLSGTTPTSVEFQYYRSIDSHTASQQGDQVFVYKLTNAGVWSVSTREASSKIAAGTGLTSSYSDGTLTLESSGGSGGEAKELTSADYNWNWSAQNATTTPFDTVALWLLEPGMYYNKNGVKVATSKTYYDSNANSYLVGAHAFFTDIVKNYPSGGDNGSIVWYKTRTDNGNASNIGLSTYQNFLTSANLTNGTGTSTTDVMSQYATTSMVYSSPSTRQQVQIGASSSSNGVKTVAVGSEARATNNYAVSVGSEAQSGGAYSVAIGCHSTAQQKSVALGYGATTTRNGEVNVGAGTTSSGYSGSDYRVIGGVYDPQDAHDAATKGYVDAHGVGVMYIDNNALSGIQPDTDYTELSLCTDVGLNDALTGETFRNMLDEYNSIALVGVGVNENELYKYPVLHTIVPTDAAYSAGTGNTPTITLMSDDLRIRIDLYPTAYDGGDFTMETYSLQNS